MSTSSTGQLFTPGQQPLFNTTSFLAARSFTAHDPLGLRAQGNQPISGAQALNVVALQGQDISVNGLTLKVAARRTIPVVDICLFKKQDRQKLDAEKKQALFDQFLKKQCPKFKPMSMQLEQDKGVLEGETSLSNIVTAVREVHAQYDTGDVFSIVFPLNPEDEHNGSALLADAAGRTQSIDLYTQYAQVTADQVAISCFWYQTWVDQSDCPWIHENLELTYRQLSQHTIVELHNKVMETYKKYQAPYHGGPLYFKILMDHLVCNFEQIASSLIQHIKSHKISALKGEEVPRTVTLLRNGCERLFSIQRLPPDMSSTVLRVYQTSSHEDFNSIFRRLEINAEIALNDSAGYNQLVPGRFLSDPGMANQAQLSIKQVCDSYHELAERKYTALVYNGKWNVPAGNGNPSAFNASKNDQKKVLVCWNCGEKGHAVDKCPKPRNEQQIEKNRSAFRKAKDKESRDSKPESSGKGEYAKPKKGEPNKRTINGKAMYYHFKRKTWLPATNVAGTEPQSSNGAPPPTVNVATPPAANAQTPSAGASPLSRDAVLATAMQQFGQTITNLQQALQG
jgi:hypothetical protein